MQCGHCEAERGYLGQDGTGAVFILYSYIYYKSVPQLAIVLQVLYNVGVVKQNVGILNGMDQVWQRWSTEAPNEGTFKM